MFYRDEVTSNRFFIQNRICAMIENMKKNVNATHLIVVAMNMLTLSARA
jgi:hypothetical protein